MSRARLLVVVTNDSPDIEPTQDELLSQLRVTSTGDLFADRTTLTPVSQPATPTSDNPLYFDAAQTVTVTTSYGGVVVSKAYGAPTGSAPTARVLRVSPVQLVLALSSTPPSGSGTSPVLHVAYAFSYNLANLHNGVVVPGWTLAEGDILRAAWFSITTAWDGTTPTADVYAVNAASNEGLLTGASGVQDMTSADDSFSGGLIRPNNHGLDYGQTGAMYQCSRVPLAAVGPLTLSLNQEGTKTGSSPGATQGAAVLHLEVLLASGATTT